MLTHVYDQVTETEFFITKIVLADEEPSKDGDGTSYSIDLTSYPDDYSDSVEILNVPLVYNEKEDSYYIADISEALLEAENNSLDVYNYNTYNPNEPNTTTQLYEAEYSDGMITSNGEPYHTEPHTTVSIYQANKEPLTQEATTIPDLIEILEYAQTLDYTEVVVSGAFTKGIKRSK